MKVTTEACLFGAWVADSVYINIRNNFLALDIGAGTGLLSLMIAQTTMGTITSVEIDASAAAQAKENSEKSKWDKRIKVVNGNIIDYQPGHRFDLIFSNPPFYEDNLQSPNKYLNLARHNAGLSLIQLLTTVNRLLEQDGIFYLLFPTSRLKELLSEAAKFALLPVKQAEVQQTETHDPFRVMIALKRNAQMAISPELITIREQGAYSKKFIELLKDYYLNL